MRFRATLQALRVHQWSKNLLVFSPLFLSHTFFEAARLRQAMIAFLGFSATASALYVMNDLLDRESDRKHPRKHRRPFAAGALSVRYGMTMTAILLALGLAAAWLLPPAAQQWLGVYLVGSALYSAVLKRLLFVDISALSALYTLRVMCGGAATGIVISPWTLAFCIFLFTSLAICKRLTELREGASPGGALPGRAYTQADLTLIPALGAGSGYVAVVVLSLYINSPEVTALYARPRLLWLFCPVLTYWISRMLIIANRGAMHDDPIVFALQDPASYAVAIAAVLTVVLAV